ncbi:MAG: hypothetical protein LWW77_08470 [Propionibacteriales bacterium]|nr:hypothetical protein [Propionibacteriales bacterium]
MAPTTTRARSSVRFAIAALAGLLSVAVTLAPTPAVAKTPPPPRALASTQIDAHLGYMPQSTCSPSAKPGAKAVLKLLINTWGGSSSGISRACGAGSRSEHKEGRALDWHMSVKSSSQRKRVNAALNWITANNGEIALRLGIMYVIWNQHIWSVYYPELGWRLMEDRGGPTANHKDHVHISLSWDGAYQQTSWWTGQPIADPLNSRCGAPGVRACLPVIGRTTAAWPYQSTTVPASFTPAPWIRPGVGGSPRVGILQRAVPGSWVPADATVTYQWTSNGTPIPGATEATYLIPPEQVGHEVEVRVTATAADGTPLGTRASNNIASVYPAPMSSSTPVIAGTPAPANTLSVNPGPWSPAPSSVSYRWLRDGKKIAGATGSTFTVRTKDRGHKISVRVTGRLLGYTTVTRTSAKVKIIKGFTSAAVAVTGSPVVGGVLNGALAGASPAPSTVRYQWYADGTPIAGANSASFTLTAQQVGASVTLTITASRSGYATTPVRSAPVGPVS